MIIISGLTSEQQDVNRKKHIEVFLEQVKNQLEKSKSFTTITKEGVYRKYDADKNESVIVSDGKIKITIECEQEENCRGYTRLMDIV